MGGNYLSIRLLATWAIIQGAANWANAGTHSVDDSDPGIRYYPSDGWNIGNDCPNCFAKPDQLSLIYQQTWHDVTSHLGNGTFYVDYSFTGTDVSVYGILVDIPGYDALDVNLILTIDGDNYTYAHTAGDTNSYEYQVPVFSVHDLPFQSHDLRVTLVPVSVFLFDYLAFKYPDSTSVSLSGSSPTPSSTGTVIIYNNVKSSLSPGAIAGIVIGVIVVVVATAALIGFFCYRRGREERRTEAQGRTAGMAPFHTSPPMAAQVPATYPTFSQPEYIPRASEPVSQARDPTLLYTPPPPVVLPSYTEAWGSDSLSHKP